ncbi:response regulator [Aporhodopirellula aestuarii]|uniref:Response regulator n=1 Tax=Aporhodopirellula aestuarii TaxID=2950107 RepID=A0ABT0TZU5_9BACT|nr:response regulator [Aporhodopirellula aestuarii]MCM2369909.1 response regulator [Aporhodopirellula aestuarii]
MTFVLVEDDELDMEVFRRALRKHKISQEIRVAKDGGEAIKLLREEFVDGARRDFIVFLDLNMAGMNGHEFLDEIRSDPDLKVAVVFVLTTSEHERDLRLAYEKNVAGYFTKGNIDYLMQAIKPYVDGVALPRVSNDENGRGKTQ